MPVLHLTQAMIAQGLPLPDGVARLEACDADLPGLYIEIRASSPGQGTFYLRYKDTTGKTCHKRIGTTTEVSLADARKQVKVLKGEIASGVNPKGEAKKVVLTYDAFFTEEYLTYIKPRLRSWTRLEELYRLRIKKVFGHLRLDAITRQEIQTFHTALLTEGLAPASADHHLKLIRQSLNHAISIDLLTTGNPAAKVRLFNIENKVQHDISEDQLAALLKMLTTSEKGTRSVCQIILFLLSTGARLNEALQAKWSQIDRRNRLWTVPATNSKSKRMRQIPLNQSAMDLLDQLDTRDKFEFLFINRQTGKPYTTIMKVWSRLRLKLGMPELRIHDMRHAHASLLANAGVGLQSIQAILGHANYSTTLRYARLNNTTIQQATEAAAACIRAAMPLTNAPIDASPIAGVKDAAVVEAA